MGFHHGARKARHRSGPRFAPLTPAMRATLTRLNPCPTCSASGGDPCRDESGRPLTDDGSHRARRDLAALKVTH